MFVKLWAYQHGFIYTRGVFNPAPGELPCWRRVQLQPQSKNTEEPANQGV